MHPISKGFMIATAVATMAIGGSLQAMAQDKAQSAPVKCAGLNSCKGQNACKGKSFVETKTAAECNQRGGTPKS